jgi:hypothetical protein
MVAGTLAKTDDHLHPQVIDHGLMHRPAVFDKLIPVPDQIFLSSGSLENKVAGRHLSYGKVQLTA